jgi:hypothetical protein
MPGGEVAVTAVDRPEFAAVHGNDGLCKQLEVSTQSHQAAADVADTRAVVMAEVGNGLEVRCHPARQPHPLDVTLRLALQPSAGGNAVQIPIDVDLEQHSGVVGGPPGFGRISAGKAWSGYFIRTRICGSFWSSQVGLDRRSR